MSPPPRSACGSISGGAALIIPTSVLAVPLGVRIAHNVSRRTLELAFASFLMLVAVRFLLSL